MKKLAIAAAAVLGVGSMVVLGSAPSAQAAATCSFYQSTDGHTLSGKCTSGTGNQYKVSAQFCSTSGCTIQSSSWKYYGSSFSITSGGYFGGTISVSTRTYV
jgi:hypothetical protein